jgi:hypothetical protein
MFRLVGYRLMKGKFFDIEYEYNMTSRLDTTEVNIHL